MQASALTEPVDVPTFATASFIEAELADAASVLEVGCGAGHLAALLSKRGFKVTGIESDPEAAALARGRGVDVAVGSWPDIEVQHANALVFTRSLHHIAQLGPAMKTARDVLSPDGMLLVEDFAFDEVSCSAIQWLISVVKRRETQKLIVRDPDSFVMKLCSSEDPKIAWHQEHDHDLHTIDDMISAIAQLFTIRNTQHAPYLYRYLVPVLPETAEAAALVGKIYDEERDLGDSGAISLIGRRVVATMA